MKEIERRSKDKKPKEKEIRDASIFWVYFVIYLFNNNKYVNFNNSDKIKFYYLNLHGFQLLYILLSSNLLIFYLYYFDTYYR